MLDFTVFSLATLIPSCNRQKCPESLPALCNLCLLFFLTLPLRGETYPETRGQVRTWIMWSLEIREGRSTEQIRRVKNESGGTNGE